MNESSAILSSAILSPDGRYRYALTRSWVAESARRVLWIMLNPSTADATVDDPTIRRVVSFSKNAGFGSCSVANLFAYRATAPCDLEKVGTTPELIGPDNGYWLNQLCTGADAAVLAWGAPAFRRSVVRVVWEQHASFVRAQVLGSVEQVFALRWTSTGQPGHPLYLPENSPWLRVTA